MKKVSIYFWILASISMGFTACSSDDEDELIGNWLRRYPDKRSIEDFIGSPRGYTATFVIGDKGYVVGGLNATKSVNRRDMCVVTVNKNSSNLTVANWSRGDSLPADMGRQRAVGFSINGKGYVGLGIDGNMENLRGDFWEYDPLKAGSGTAAWRKVKDFEGQLRYGATAFTVNGKVFVTGGYTGSPDNEYLKDLWQFIPPADENDEGDWVEITNTPSKKRAYATYFMLPDETGKEWIYLCTGRGGSGNLTDFQRFDGETWEDLRPICDYYTDDDFDDEYAHNIERQWAIGFTMKGLDAQLKGYISAGDKTSTWEYTPPVYDSNHNLISGDIWEQKTDFRSRTGAFALIFPDMDTNPRGVTDNFVLIGTGESGGFFYDDVWVFQPTEENVTGDE